MVFTAVIVRPTCSSTRGEIMNTHRQNQQVGWKPTLRPLLVGSGC